MSNTYYHCTTIELSKKNLYLVFENDNISKMAVGLLINNRVSFWYYYEL